jgi:hypothetical protein
MIAIKYLKILTLVFFTILMHTKRFEIRAEAEQKSTASVKKNRMKPQSMLARPTSSLNKSLNPPKTLSEL